MGVPLGMSVGDVMTTSSGGATRSKRVPKRVTTLSFCVSRVGSTLVARRGSLLGEPGRPTAVLFGMGPESPTGKMAPPIRTPSLLMWRREQNSVSTTQTEKGERAATTR